MYDDLDEAFRENPNNFITRLHGFDDSNAYAFVIRTDQLQPFIKPETVLVASPAAECQSGDLVIAFYNDGQYTIRVVTYHEGYVQLSAYNQTYKDIVIPDERLQWCHKIAIIPMPYSFC